MKRSSIRKTDRSHYEENTSQKGHAVWRHASDENRIMKKDATFFIKPMEDSRNILKDCSAEISNNLCEERMIHIKSYYNLLTFKKISNKTVK